MGNTGFDNIAMRAAGIPGVTLSGYATPKSEKKIYEYDYAVFIGRFQPFHNGHKAVVDKALSLAERVIILVGSANLGRSTRNPFTFTERREMIDAVYPGMVDQRRLIILPLNDHTYDNDGWIEEVQTTVRNTVLAQNRGWTDRGTSVNLNSKKVTLIGRNKDNTSFYLKLFPNWSSEDAYHEDAAFINATDIRWSYFNKDAAWAIEDKNTPLEVFNLMNRWKRGAEYVDVLEEHEYCAKYAEPYKVLPYPVTFNTTDAIIKCSGHILLVTRKARPGRGLLALPGGFLDHTETLFESCLREVYEETRLSKMYDNDLRKSLVCQRSFDDPHRDPRGRFITQAFYFDLGNLTKLPIVRGGSDANKAQWVPIGELRADNMFADHYFIIRQMLKTQG